MVIRVDYKRNSYLNNGSEKLFCQANCFTFQSNQDSFFAKYIKFVKSKELKKKVCEELMPREQHPKIWCKFCVSDDEKKETEPVFTDSL